MSLLLDLEGSQEKRLSHRKLFLSRIDQREIMQILGNRSVVAAVGFFIKAESALV